MGFERKKIEKIENNNRKSERIDLSSLSFNFCSDQVLADYYEKELINLNDSDGWAKENSNKILRNQEKIDQAIKDGLILDGSLESIRMFQIQKTKDGQKRALELKNRIENDIDTIKVLIGKKLAKFLPDWYLSKASINFIINSEADFCIDGGNITVDLGRLTFGENFLNTAIEGITHEVFHVWMSEQLERSFEEKEASAEEIIDKIILRTIDEGLAVVISGQSLESHHKEQGRDYQKYIQESFSVFNSFLRIKDGERLSKIMEIEFKNMGHFYVVGYEVFNRILQNEGLESFREMLKNFKDNPNKLVDKFLSVFHGMEHHK